MRILTPAAEAARLDTILQSLRKPSADVANERLLLMGQAEIRGRVSIFLLTRGPLRSQVCRPRARKPLELGAIRPLQQR